MSMQGCMRHAEDLNSNALNWLVFYSYKSLVTMVTGNEVLKWDVQGVPAFSELGFAAAALPENVKVAAVTGTNGKSTVTTFTSQVDRFENLGQPNNQSAAWLAGLLWRVSGWVTLKFLTPVLAAASVVEKCRSADVRGRQSRHSTLRGCFAVPCIPCRRSSF
jgi:hypothetical protein